MHHPHAYVTAAEKAATLRHRNITGLDWCCHRTLQDWIGVVTEHYRIGLVLSQNTTGLAWCCHVPLCCCHVRLFKCDQWYGSKKSNQNLCHLPWREARDVWCPPPLSGISGLSFDSPFLSSLLFFCLVLLLFLSCHFSTNGPFSCLFFFLENSNIFC